MTDQIRLNKFVAKSGLCTRREAAHRIKAGMIKVNGEVVKEPATLISPTDMVTFGNKVIQLKEEHVYILMNKPKNTLSIMQEKVGEKTLLKVLGGKVTNQVIPVEPLAKNDTGLLLLTTDQKLIDKLSVPNPKSEVVYHITLEETLTESNLAEILANDQTQSLSISSINPVRGKELNEIEVDLPQGNYEALKSLFKELGFSIIKMDRIYFNGITKKDLSRDRFRHLTDKEVIMLKHFK